MSALKKLSCYLPAPCCCLSFALITLWNKGVIISTNVNGINMQIFVKTVRQRSFFEHSHNYCLLWNGQIAWEIFARITLLLTRNDLCTRIRIYAQQALSKAHVKMRLCVLTSTHTKYFSRIKGRNYVRLMSFDVFMCVLVRVGCVI